MSSPHGTISRYTNGKCRCSDCRDAMADYARQANDRRAASVPADIHGKNSTYINYECRCNECRRAHTEKQRERREKKRARPLRIEAAE